MNDDASGAPASMPASAPASAFALRRVPPATAQERLTREEGMARALELGATPYRDAEDKGRYVLFKEANLAPIEPWRRDPRNKRRYRRVQELRKAAGQLIGQPGDRIEIAKRLGVLHWEEGSDIEGAAARGLYDAIWSREHIYDSFDVPRRYGRSHVETGRVAAVAEEEARKLQAEDPKARGGFWVRMRNDLGLVYVVPNADPEAQDEEIVSGESQTTLAGEADPNERPEEIEGAANVGAGATASDAADANDSANGGSAEGEEDFDLEPGAELEVLRQLGVDVDAPTLPGSRIHALKASTARQVERPAPRDRLEAIAQGFEREWQHLQKRGLRYYVPPELRDLYDAIPSAQELAGIAISLLPGSGEAQSLLAYNEAANRFAERLGAGDLAGAQQAPRMSSPAWQAPFR